MPPQPQRVMTIETTWIREYARTYMPSEAGFLFCDDDLRTAGMTLIAVRHVLRHGQVVFADKLDEQGALWVVDGQDNDGKAYRVTIKVISEELNVTLIKIEILQAIELAAIELEIEGKDDGYDAA